MTVRLVLVDDHRLVREGMRVLLDKEPDLQVVGDAGDAASAVTVIGQQNPDVVVTDIGLPGADGLSLIRQLMQREPKVRVLVLSMFSREDYVEAALNAGAAGYATKDQGVEEVAEAIRTVARGRSYLAPHLARAVLKPSQKKSDPNDPLRMLSRREREVFALVVRGLKNERIAGELNISMKTVETHRTHINRKLGAHSTADLVRFAAMHRLLDDANIMGFQPQEPILASPPAAE